MSLQHIHFWSLNLWLLSVFLAIQFVLSDEFSHLRPEQRLALLHVSTVKCQTHYRSQLLF